MVKIMIFGTFDMIHEGHEDFFKQARSLAPDAQLIVSVARDAAAQRHRGFLPQNNENVRLETLQQHSLIDRAILGDEEGFIEHIVRENPDVIALGYDQAGEYVEGLELALRDAGLTTQILRMQPYKPETFKTSKLRA
jgi:FAD synthetase